MIPVGYRWRRGLCPSATDWTRLEDTTADWNLSGWELRIQSGCDISQKHNFRQHLGRGVADWDVFDFTSLRVLLVLLVGVRGWNPPTLLSVKLLSRGPISHIFDQPSVEICRTLPQIRTRFQLPPCQFQRDLLSDLTFSQSKGGIRMNSVNSVLMSQLYSAFAGVCFASAEVRLGITWNIGLPFLIWRLKATDRIFFTCFLQKGYKNARPSSSLPATADCHRMSPQLLLTNNKAQRKSLFPTADSLLSSAFPLPSSSLSGSKINPYAVFDERMVCWHHLFLDYRKQPNVWTAKYPSSPCSLYLQAQNNDFSKSVQWNPNFIPFWISIIWLSFTKGF